VKPDDISLIRVPGRPAFAAGGQILVAVSTPDLEANLYRGTLVRIQGRHDSGHDSGTESGQDSDQHSDQPGRLGDHPVALTVGPRDSEPVTSPDGGLVVFLRAAESGPPQLYAMPVGGGEPRKLTDHPLGAGPAVFAPDGSSVAYCAAVPESGRYGTDEAVGVDAEPPRRVTRLSYRLDGEGFVLDKARQVFVLDVTGQSAPSTEPQAGPAPVQLTDEPSGADHPAFTGDGRLLYVRPSGTDELTEEIAVINLPADPVSPGASTLGRGERLIATRGSAAGLVVDGSEIFYLGAEFTGVDAVARTNGLWAAPLAGGSPRRLTDEESVDADLTTGRPAPGEGTVLFAVLDRGSVGLRAAPVSAEKLPLTELAEVIGGDRVVRSFTRRGGRVAAVVADGATAGELVTVELTADLSGGSNHAAGERRPDVSRMSDFSRELTGAGLWPATPLAARSADGYPVHGWLVTPDGPGPHPVLLLVHGGPHSAYTSAFFDEAQVYAGAGYAVVMGNPRGSAGYGQSHGRSVVGALGTVDVDDVLALLDEALRRPECDPSRVGVMGGSYGGFMTCWLSAHAPGRFTAAISERALNAWDSFAGSSDIGYYFAKAYVGTDHEALWRISPLAYADRIEIPLLIIHSEQDWRCPVEQAQRMFVALKNRGAEVEMLLFPGEGHELSRSGRPRHRQQRFDAILQWWARYLPVRPVAEPA
jgi:dipeptidyl aminopeptidase/acylaminoacyl peptidase